MGTGLKFHVNLNIRKVIVSTKIFIRMGFGHVNDWPSKMVKAKTNLIVGATCIGKNRDTKDGNQ